MVSPTGLVSTVVGEVNQSTCFQLVLRINPSEGNFLPHTGYEGIVDTIVQLF
jgi:hypothetical protein